MSYRTLDAIGGNMGGPAKLLADPKKARNINVTILNPTASTVGVFFGHSPRELSEAPPIGFAGYAVIGVPNTVANQTLGGIAYTTALLEGWVGALYAVSSPAGIVIDAMEAFPEG